MDGSDSVMYRGKFKNILGTRVASLTARKAPPHPWLTRSSLVSALLQRPGLLGLLKAFFCSTWGCRSACTTSSVISSVSSTSIFLSTVSPASRPAISSTALFIRGYIIRYLMDLVPAVVGHV